MAFQYDEFVKRNNGYISNDIQGKIRNARVLFAGCGLGSGPVICAARTGFQHFVLIDGDTVDAHNLNRQFFDFDDVGTPKVEALKKHILRINPEAKVEAHVAMLDKANAAELVSKVDMIFDTIDFVDLEAVLALHGNAAALAKPIFTAMNIGFGAGVLYFPPGSGQSLPELLQKDVEAAAAEGNLSYTAVFTRVMSRIGAHLDRQVMEEVAKALTIMEDGTACPASQIAVGSFSVAALAMAMMHDMLAGLEVPGAPHMVIHSFRNHTTKLVNIAG
ncbi:HesA/MoeB/ThiF family protein [Telluria aromaticivorans]|uniref:ThiF family adenylyltransferase n=1 Tax=Telluria aromaticivorans TaxID=2725995 RepID=A0A7Y2P0I6_9BURK|nr:ThiF family adenylyltransferase [Telluria aromaticivorans]NNG24189.1 ThiF family adenylyltransferase [Telluria aromaticivorans]